jgi:hypothetical protein
MDIIGPRPKSVNNKLCSQKKRKSKMLERSFSEGFSVDGMYAAYWAEPEYPHDMWNVAFQVVEDGANLKDTRAYYLDKIIDKKAISTTRKGLLHGVLLMVGKTAATDTVVLSLNKCLERIENQGMFIGERNGKRAFEKAEAGDISNAFNQFEQEAFEFKGTHVGYAACPDEVQYGFCNVRSIMYVGQAEASPVLKPNTIYNDVIVLISPMMSTGQVAHVLSCYVGDILVNGMFAGYTCGDPAMKYVTGPRRVGKCVSGWTLSSRSM